MKPSRRIGCAAQSALHGLAIAAAWSVTTVASAQSALPLDTIKLPPGFAIETVARVPNARAMTWGAQGTLFVGSAGAGTVYAVTLPRAGTQDAARVRTIARDLREPAGVAFHNGALYVSAVSRIFRYDDIERKLDAPPDPVLVSDAFPRFPPIRRPHNEPRKVRKYIPSGRRVGHVVISAG